MKITAITSQQKNVNRVNVMVDGKYRFSLDIFQVGELGIKIDKEYSEEELVEFEQESQFGKLYARALEYTMLRPHSEREIKDYLWRKTRTTRTKEGIEKPGVPQSLADRVLERLKEKKYIDDEEFARYWFEYRSQTKGTSLRKLENELRVKGVDSKIIDQRRSQTNRADNDELRKVIAKKKSKYPDEQKLIVYLMRQGFRYDDVKEALKTSKD